MDGQIITIDRNFEIQRRLQSFAIPFRDYTECLSHQNESIVNDSHSGCLVITTPSAESESLAINLINQFSTRTNLVILTGDKGNATSNSHVFWKKFDYSPLQEINPTTITLFLNIVENLKTIDQLRHEKHCYRAMVDSCPDYVFVRDKNCRIVAANSQIAGLHDLNPDQMIGKTYEELTGDIEGSRNAVIQDREILASGKPFYQSEDFYHDEAGNKQWNRVTKKRIPNHQGSDYFILGVATNLTEWKKNELKLTESENNFRELFRREQCLRKITDTITTAENSESMLTFVGHQLVELFNASIGEILDQRSDSELVVLNRGKTSTIQRCISTETSKGKSARAYETPNGSSVIAAQILLDDDQKYIFYLARKTDKQAFSMQDAELLQSIANQCMVAITRINLNDIIEYQAFHDSLTGLPNRWSYEQTLQQKLSESITTETQFGVLFLDLDGFKAINDMHGHLIGDKVLNEAARRLASVLDDHGFLARMGGDEFSIVLNNVSSIFVIHAFCMELLKKLQEEISVDSNTFKISASIGVAIFPKDGTESTELMRKADSAMYHAKESTNLNIGFFSREIEINEQRRQRLEADLHTAIESNLLELHFQPQYDLKNGNLTGAEALTRWQHPELGSINPDEFINIAEQSSLILKLGDWVTKTTLHQLKNWESQNYRLKIAINFSPIQCEQLDFSDNLLDMVTTIGLDKSLVQIEVTESTLMKDRESLTRHLQALRAQGMTIAIDDFGTGYSSLGYLQHLPLDVLKIDRSFIAQMDVKDPFSSLISVITRMAGDLGLHTVAEGVETAEQLRATTLIGCDQAQGWFFAKAMPVCEFTELLRNQRWKEDSGSKRAA